MIRTYVDFSRKIREWDGFGVSFANNSCQTPNLSPSLFSSSSNIPPEYDLKKNAELLFGSSGLRINIIKTFLNSNEQKQENTKYNESDTIDTKGISCNPFDDRTGEFCNSAIAASTQWGGALKMLCTFTNPPGWMTKQKVTGGKDLEPSHRIDYARLMVAGLKYLVERKYPIKYMSMHYHGEDWERWCENGETTDNCLYSMYWPPELVVDFLKLLRRMLDRNDLAGIGLTPGEIGGWLRFVDWGYANAILDDPDATQSLGLLTSTSLVNNSDPSQHLLVNSSGIDEIREHRTGIHAWFTALHPVTPITSFLMQIRNSIYNSKVNAVILGDAIELSRGNNECLFAPHKIDHTCSVSDPFYYLKLLCRSGQPGTAVCQVACNTNGAALIGFSGNATKNHDAFIIINASDTEYDLPIEIRGSANGIFGVFRTSSFERYQNLGNVNVKEGKIHFKAIPFSATAFHGSI
jgi:hypothetical protein